MYRANLLKSYSKALLSVLVLATVSFAGAKSSVAQTPDKIGIFDLKTLRSTPLDVEVLSKTKKDDINIEQIRFTSLPGVRIYAILTYKDGAKNAPGFIVVERFRATPRIDEAKNGFVGVVIEPPTGNTDPKRMESVGGPKYHQPFSINEQFQDDPNQSYIYQYTVALIRGMDYLATRPEVNLSTSVVTGYSWAGTMVGLLHALDDRPAAFIVYHGLGYYADEQGMSGGVTAPISRKAYEMYSPAAYAQYGTKPIYVGTALDDYYTKLPTIMEEYNNLKSPKVFAFSPNRHHTFTSRNEFGGYALWQGYWLFNTEKPTTIGEGTVKADGGKVVYTCDVDTKYPLTHSDVMVSYGKPGDWMCRTWHRFPLTKQGDHYQAEIPIYDPAVPFYVVGQVETEKFSDVANGPQFIDPSKLGISASNATYPDVLFDPSQKDDLYIATGNITWSADGKGCATVTPGDEGTITFQNIDGDLWKGKKELHISLKGDGQPGPIRAYLAYQSNYYLEIEAKNYTEFDLVPTGKVFANGWQDYTIPLDKVKNLEKVSVLFFDPNKRNLQIGPITLK